MGQFEPKWDPLLLIAIMREVLAAVDADPPESATQRAYNEARAAAGHPDSPRRIDLSRAFGSRGPRSCSERSPRATRAARSPSPG